MHTTITAPPELPGYSFVRTLGSGSTADVYLYRQRVPDRDVAVKVSRTPLDPRAAARFAREADTMARLSSHPYIMQVHGAGVTPDGSAYIVFEYAPNGTYKEIARRRPLTCDQMLDLGIRLAGALSAAHRAGVIHHDIKTSNVLVNAQGLPVLADFGISTNIYDRTFTGYSLPWAPPEVLNGRSGAEEADIYSLAATLYATLAGSSPFECGYRPDTAARLRELILTKPLPPIDRPDVPEDVERVLRRAMSKDPEDRQHSALRFARDLQHVQQEHFGHMTAVVAEGRNPYPPDRRAARRRFGTPQTGAPARAATPAVAGQAVAGLAVAVFVITVALVFAIAVMPNLDSGAVTDRASVGDATTRRGTEAGRDADVTPDGVVGDDVPSPTDLHGEYGDDGTVTFTWSNPDPKRGDTYAWRPIDGQDPQDEGNVSIVRGERVTFDVSRDTARTCIEVSVVRADRRMSPRPAAVCAMRR